MSYTVSFYTFDAFGRERVLTVHEVPALAISAYTDSPGIALAAARSVDGPSKPCGFRVVDGAGAAVLEYRDVGAERS